MDSNTVFKTAHNNIHNATNNNNNSSQYTTRNQLNSSNNYYQKHISESNHANGPNKYKNTYDNSNDTTYKPNSYHSNNNQRYSSGHQHNYHHHHNQEYNHSYNANQNFKNKYKQKNEMGDHAVNALGVANGEVLPLNKPIVPIKRVIKPDTKHMKSSKQNYQPALLNANQYNLSNMHNNITSNSNANTNNNKTGGSHMPSNETTSKSSEVVTNKSTVISHKVVHHSNSPSANKNIVSDDMRKQLRELIDNYLIKCPNGLDDEDKMDDFDAHLDRTMQQLCDLFKTNEQLSEAISLIIIHSFNNKTDMDRLNLSKLFIRLNSIKLPLPVNTTTFVANAVAQSTSSSMTVEIFMNALKQILNNLAELESHHHLVKSHLSLFVARAVCDQIITLNDLANLMKYGAYYPLFFLCMQNMHKLKSQNWLRDQLELSKILLLDMLPSKSNEQKLFLFVLLFDVTNFSHLLLDGDRNKERLAQILEDRALGFVYPMLKLEPCLHEQIQSNQVSCSQLKEWIDTNISSEIQNTISFIQSLVTW